MKLAFVALLVFCTICTFGQKQQVSILIDPGHGGRDPGHLPLTDNGLQEKVLALKIAMKVGYYLANNLANIQVTYTRTDDSYPTLDQRVDLANNGIFDYMLSIHINGNPNPAVYGTETIIHNYQSKDAYKWADMVEQQFRKRAGRKSRGVKTSADLGHSLQILKFTKIPTIVVECGFITNGSESYYLSTEYGQDILASAIFRATREFVSLKHPDIDFKPKPQEEEIPEEEIPLAEACYRIQIMASKTPLELDIPQFKALKYPVDRVEIETISAYKYRYYVGRFSTKKEAREMRREIRSQGFEDAFIAYVE